MTEAWPACDHCPVTRDQVPGCDWEGGPWQYVRDRTATLLAQDTLYRGRPPTECRQACVFDGTRIAYVTFYPDDSVNISCSADALDDAKTMALYLAKRITDATGAQFIALEAVDADEDNPSSRCWATVITHWHDGELGDIDLLAALIVTLRANDGGGALTPAMLVDLAVASLG